MDRPEGIRLSCPRRRVPRKEPVRDPDLEPHGRSNREHAALREVLGTAPSVYACYRFTTKLRENAPMLDACLGAILASLKEIEPELGRNLALDGSDMPRPMQTGSASSRRTARSASGTPGRLMLPPLRRLNEEGRGLIGIQAARARGVSRRAYFPAMIPTLILAGLLIGRWWAVPGRPSRGLHCY